MVLLTSIMQRKNLHAELLGKEDGSDQEAVDEAMVNHDDDLYNKKVQRIGYKAAAADDDD